MPISRLLASAVGEVFTKLIPRVIVAWRWAQLSRNPRPLVLSLHQGLDR